MDNYPVLKIKKGRERSLLNKHPWIFSGAVESVQETTNGQIVQVVDSSSNILGHGFYHDKNQITVKMFDFSSEHTLFDEAYWEYKISSAITLRNTFISQNTNAYRLIHAEGDFFPGLIIDIYANTAVVQILHKGVQLISEILFKILNDKGFPFIFIKQKEHHRNNDNVTIEKGWYKGKPNPSHPIQIIENGIKFEIDVVNGQKTGFFIDQRDNRQLLKTLSKNKTVLNTFSYTGGFSLYALAGDASKVVSVDVSKDATASCINNIELNHFTKHKAIAADCFDYLKEMPSDEFDIIVLDPPAFAKTSKAVSQAARGYKEINLKALSKIKKGGLIFTYSCSQYISPDLFRKIVFGAVVDSGRNVQILKQLSQGSDHPISIFHPEGEYLKGLLLLVN